LVFRVLNEDDKPFEFTAALHSYFEVLAIKEATVRGLKGLSYLDKSADPKNPAVKKEDREEVTFGEGLVDSVYRNAPEHVELLVGTGVFKHLTSPGKWVIGV
jgi:glucose-6-phosphate 1-epimerase